MRAKSNYMPPEQFAKVILTIPSLNIRRWKDLDIQMLFKICYHCALRINEGLRLTTGDFFLQDREIYLGKTKKGKEEVAVIPPDFMSELSLYLLEKKGPLFQPELKYITVYKWIERLGKTLEIPAWMTGQDETGEKTKTHIFRKSIAKDMMYGNMGEKAPLNVISQHLRHKGRNPLAATSQYLKLGIEDVKDWFVRTEEEKD